MSFFQKCFTRRGSDLSALAPIIHRQIIAQRTIDSRNEVKKAFSDLSKQSIPVSNCNGRVGIRFCVGLVLIGATFLNPLLVIEFLFSTEENDEVFFSYRHVLTFRTVS